MTSGSAAVASGCPVAPGGYDAPPQPLGPDSLTWKYFGDWRGMLQGPWAGLDAEHAPAARRRRRGALDFFRRERMAAAVAVAVPDRRRGVRRRPRADDRRRGPRLPHHHQGRRRQGRRYHALNPDVFYWAHSTFFVGTIHVAERFFGGITEDEKRQLFDEHITWYRMYGMSMRPVPETWEDFQAYWDHMCREVLERQQGHARRPRSREVSETTVRRNGFRTGCGRRYSDGSSLRSWCGCASGCTTHRCAN